MGGPYNLLDEQWIPVLYHDGRWERVGIIKALKEAGQIRQIAASNPMDRVALLRFLLAVLYWCRGNPPADDEKRKVLASGQFPAGWFGKLDEHRDCFNLLGEGNRFYQDPNAQRERAVTDLLQEVPTGNNFWHFKHATDGKHRLCLACCAMGLLRLPLFSVSGLPDLKAGINGTPPVYLIAIGQTLQDTLLLNWRKVDCIGDPAWIRTGMANSVDGAIPMLVGLTMLSRRVWLHGPEPADVCIGCGGRDLPLIRTCEFQTAGEQHNEAWDDPHVLYMQKTTKEGRTQRRAITASDPTKSYFQMDKPWAELLVTAAASAHCCDGGKRRGLLTVGFATDKAKNIDVWERIVLLPDGLGDSSRLAAATGCVDRWDEQVRRTGDRLGRTVPAVRGATVAAGLRHVRPHVEAQLSSRMGELLDHSTPDGPAWATGIEELSRMLQALAVSLSPGATTSALQRRNQIVKVLPSLSPESAKTVRQPRRRKGAKK